MKINNHVITMIAMRKLKIENLYDEEVEKKIVKRIKEKNERAERINRIRSVLELL